jgi:hypothetical protein
MGAGVIASMPQTETGPRPSLGDIHISKEALVYAKEEEEEEC